MLMHETMVAQSLLAAISDEAAKHNAKPVGAKISCGKLSAINDEALFFAFEAIAKGTSCEGVKLDIEHKPMHGRCKKCDQSFEVELRTPFCNTWQNGNPLEHPGCSKCGSDDFELLPDAPLMLEEIELQTD
jgi:hydrogenase nickel incorporation protein HypA/HybF